MGASQRKIKPEPIAGAAQGSDAPGELNPGNGAGTARNSPLSSVAADLAGACHRLRQASQANRAAAMSPAG